MHPDRKASAPAPAAGGIAVARRGAAGREGGWAVSTICNACSESRLPGPLDTGMLRAGTTKDGEWGSGGRDSPAVKCWSIAGDKQQKGREGWVKNSCRDQSREWRQGMRWGCLLGRESEAMGHGILQNTLRAGALISDDDLAENLNLTVSL